MLLRGVLAVLAGTVLVVLTRFIPTDSLALTVCAVIAAAALAGYLAGWIAGRFELRVASVLGFVMVLLGGFSVVQRSARQPNWQEVAIAGCGPVAALLGAGIRLLTK